MSIQANITRRAVKDTRNMVNHAIADGIAYLMNNRVYDSGMDDAETDEERAAAERTREAQAELEQMICRLVKAREALA